MGTPTDKPRVERTIHYAQNNFWAGEAFTALTQTQAAAVAATPPRNARREIFVVICSLPTSALDNKGVIGAGDSLTVPGRRFTAGIQPNYRNRAREAASLGEP